MEGAVARANLILDRYEPIGTAGTGGFGMVQIAWDPRIQRKVAIKTIQLTEQDAYRAGLPGADAVAHRSDASQPPSLGSEGDAGASSTAGRWHGVQPWSEFLAGDDASRVDGAAVGADAPEPETYHALAKVPGLDEARTAAMLSDPRIVTVFDFEVRDRTAYLIMEYIEGITLTKILRSYADWLTLDVVAAVFESVAGALTTAHEGGVLHLDIKPDNILVNAKGEVKVTDFGLATLADVSGTGTTGGGTIGYMPLEQMRREHLDARSDEWSLAAVTYEMLTGENPFLAKGLVEAEAAIEDAELVLPSLCWESLDPQIDDVMFYALDPDRDERYASVADFAEEASKFLGDADEGKVQLASIVEDALGLAGDPAPEADERPRESAARGIGVVGLLKSLIEGDGNPAEPIDGRARNAMPIEPPEEYDEPYEDEGEEKPAKPRASKESRRRPLRECLDARTRGFLARAFAALASGAIGFLAASNMPVLEVFGSGRLAVVIALAIAAGALAIVRPHVGALVSFALLAIALVMNGGILPAVVLLVALAAWWYFVAKESAAASNVGLSAPLLGSVGAAPVVPLLAGASLHPIQAVATTAFAAVCALVLASFGSESLLGWDAASRWLVGSTDATSAFIDAVKQPSTWIVAASWLVAAFAQSALSANGKRWARILGLTIATAVVAAVGVVLFGVSVQLVVPLLVAFVVLLAV